MPLVKTGDAGKLKGILASYSRVLIMTHKNPDPDALGAAAGMRLLVQKVAGLPSTIGYGGFLTRAENKQMVERLNLHVEHMDDMDMRRYRGVILVDTQPAAGNNPLTEGQTVLAVVDHHAVRAATRSCPFALVDRKVGATSTLVFELLKTADVRITARIASALFLGIKTDTQDAGRDAGPRDLAAYKELFAAARHKVIAQITHPRLSNEYYRVVHRALETAMICGDCLYAPVGDVATPEFVSEVADYLVALKGLRWVIVTGRFAENLYFSTRTLTARKDAGRLLQEAIGKYGVAGGHQKMAGGLLPLSEMEPEKREAAEAMVISKLFEALGANTSVTRALLAKNAGEDRP